MPATVALNSTNVRNSIALAWSRMHLGVASVLAPSRAVETAARLFATPPRHAHTAREQELLATGTAFEVSADWTPDQSRTAASGVTNSNASGVTLKAWRFGATTRPAIVMSHGWGGRGAQFRAFVPALLDAGYQVIVFDHIGHGFSSGRESSLVHFMRGIDAVVRRVESQGAPVVALIGHSLGAAAAGAWLNANGREMRAVLVAPPTSIERYSGWFARKLGLPESVRREMQQRIERALGHRWEEFEPPQSVRNVRAKALVVHDAGDREVAPASGLALARAWPGAKFLRTEGLGHRAILRDPEVVADVLDFITDRVVFAPPPKRGEASAYFEPAPIA
jgi:pimeloyl-ACP methyl ester carboxylesterase